MVEPGAGILKASRTVLEQVTAEGCGRKKIDRPVYGRALLPFLRQPAPATLGFAAEIPGAAVGLFVLRRLGPYKSEHRVGADHNLVLIWSDASRGNDGSKSVIFC